MALAFRAVSSRRRPSHRGAALGCLAASQVEWLQPGERAAHAALADFLARLGKYDEARNDPCDRRATSHLSPYLHFGHISAQRVALAVQRAAGDVPVAKLFTNERTTGAQAFVEELVVRRELADNFCWYNPRCVRARRERKVVSHIFLLPTIGREVSSRSEGGVFHSAPHQEGALDEAP